MAVPLLARRSQWEGSGDPLPDFDPSEHAAIIRAVRAAWGLLLAAHDRPRPLPGETHINKVMERLLNEIRVGGAISGFTCDVFESVVRGAETEGADGLHEKKPDLTFRRCARLDGADYDHDRALHAECKIVDETHPLADYFAKGVRRFVVGAYARRMPCGLMIAYVRGGATTSTTLLPELQGRGSPSDPCCSTAVQLDADGTVSSSHPRHHVSLEVRLRHVWLDETP